MSDARGLFRSRRNGTALAALALTVALPLGLSACGDASEGAAAEPSAARTASNGDVFNDADVAFATDMVPHHAQAIEMVTLTQGRTLDPEVVALAEQVRAAQSPEVEQMVDWLVAWGEEVPETSLDHANAGHSHGGGAESTDAAEGMEGMDESAMPGMMTSQEMTELRESSDAEFEDRWLSMMIEHHAGAVEMARAQVDDGRFADAIALAETIIETQEAEIEQLQALLDG